MSLLTLADISFDSQFQACAHEQLASSLMHSEKRNQKIHRLQHMISAQVREHIRT